MKKLLYLLCLLPSISFAAIKVSVPQSSVFNTTITANNGIIIAGGSSLITSTQSALTVSVNGVATSVTVNGSSLTIPGTGINGAVSLFQVSGATFNVQANGNVGIGTTLPNQLLTAIPGSGATGTILVFSSASSVSTFISATNNSGGFGIVGTGTNHTTLLYSNNTEQARITSDRGLWMNGGTSTPTAVASHAGLFAVTMGPATELKAQDSAGNITTLSPHPFSDDRWFYQSENIYSGRKITIDMEKLARLVKTLADHIPGLDSSGLMEIAYDGVPVDLKTDDDLREESAETIREASSRPRKNRIVYVDERKKKRKAKIKA